MIRIEYGAGVTGIMRSFLGTTFSVDERSVFGVTGPLDIAAFTALCHDEKDTSFSSRGHRSSRYGINRISPCSNCSGGTTAFSIIRTTVLIR